MEICFVFRQFTVNAIICNTLNKLATNFPQFNLFLKKTFLNKFNSLAAAPFDVQIMYKKIARQRREKPIL